MCRATLHDGAVTGGTWTAIMSRKQMLNQSVDSTTAFAAQLGVFVDRKILGAASLLRRQKRSCGFAPEVIEFLALHSPWHVYSDSTRRLDAGKSTSVLLTNEPSGAVGRLGRSGNAMGTRKAKVKGKRQAEKSGCLFPLFSALGARLLLLRSVTLTR